MFTFTPELESGTSTHISIHILGHIVDGTVTSSHRNSVILGLGGGLEGDICRLDYVHAIGLTGRHHLECPATLVNTDGRLESFVFSLPRRFVGDHVHFVIGQVIVTVLGGAVAIDGCFKEVFHGTIVAGMGFIVNYSVTRVISSSPSKNISVSV